MAFKTSLKIASGFGNLSFRGGPFFKPDQISVEFAISRFSNSAGCCLYIEISKAPRRVTNGGLLIESWSSMFSKDGSRAQRSLKISVALRLNTCQDLHTSKEIIQTDFGNASPSGLVDVDFLGDVITLMSDNSFSFTLLAWNELIFLTASVRYFVRYVLYLRYYS